MKTFFRVGEVLNGILRKKKLLDEFELMKVLCRWEEIVGERVAKWAKPLRAKKRVLYVEVKDPSYLSHLEFLKEELKRKIVEKVGTEFKDIKLILSD